jgi:hypothetical protein
MSLVEQKLLTVLEHLRSRTSVTSGAPERLAVSAPLVTSVTSGAPERLAVSAPLVTEHLRSRMSLVEQKLLTIPEHLMSPPVFSGVCIAQSLVFCVVLCRSLFVLFFLSLYCRMVSSFCSTSDMRDLRCSGTVSSFCSTSDIRDLRCSGMVSSFCSTSDIRDLS